MKVGDAAIDEEVRAVRAWLQDQPQWRAFLADFD